MGNCCSLQNTQLEFVTSKEDVNILNSKEVRIVIENPRERIPRVFIRIIKVNSFLKKNFNKRHRCLIASSSPSSGLSSKREIFYYRSIKVYRWKQIKGSSLDYFLKRFNDLNQIRNELNFPNNLKEMVKRITTYPVGLQKLSLKLFNFGLLKDKDLELIISRISTNFPQLKQLKIDIGDYLFPTEEGLRLLGLYFANYLYKLRELSLAFRSCPGMSQQSFLEIGSMGIYLRNLQSLTLKLFSSNDLPPNVIDEDIEALAFQIPTHMAGLRELTLEFSRCIDITDQSVSSLSNIIGTNLANLQKLDLAFPGCSNISNKSLEAIGHNIITKLKNLNQLALNFSMNDKITDKGFKGLAPTFPMRRVFTKQLELKFYRCSKISDKGLEELASILATCYVYLQRLSLDFNSSNITDTGLEALVSKLSHTLKHLTLSVSNCNPTDKSLELLQNKISTSLVHLEKLELAFSSCKLITDKGLGVLVSAIGTHLVHLKQLKLDLDSCDKITNRTMEAIGSNILSRLVGLRLLELDFSNCTEITDKGLKELEASILAHLTELQRLILFFSKIPNASEEVKEALKKSLTLNSKCHIQFDSLF